MSTPSVLTPKRLVTPAQLTGSATTLYTVPTGTTTQIKQIILCNDTTSAVTATLYLVPTGGSAGVTNLILNAKAIPTDGSPLIYAFDEGLIMNAGDTLQGLASTTAQVTYHVTGDELA